MATVYFFGTGIAPSQEDYTKDIFRSFLAMARNECQICVHRRDNYLHYAYIRRIDNGTYFGICIVLDKIYNNVDSMFTNFDKLFTNIVVGGEMLTAVKENVIRFAITDFAQEPEARNEYARQLINALAISSSTTTTLSPEDYSIAKNNCMKLSVEHNSQQEIIDATQRYVNLYITRTYSEIAKITSFYKIIEKKDNEIKNLTSDLRSTKKQLTDAKRQLSGAIKKTRNTAIIAFMSIVIVIAGVVIYNKVLFPAEVTNKRMAEYNYYGPLNKDGKPDGVGVAIYRDDDKDGRKYYFGGFVNGERQDTAAVLFYKSGDFFYGKMEGDKWENGICFRRDKKHFDGTFDENNKPYTGIWYKHVVNYHLDNGVRHK